MRVRNRSSLFVGMMLVLSLLGMGTLLMSSPARADAPVVAGIFTGITVDGSPDDWADVPATTTTIIRPMATSERIVNGLEWKVVHDDAYIYFLFMVNDDYDYNVTDHHLSAALAVLFQIDVAASPDMGGGNGNVDIWHWELDCGPGELSGFNLMNGNDPPCNLDDEWASSVMDRFDDDQGNEVYGSWSHTDMSAQGAAGKWIFEMKRSLKTSDTLNQDRQFTIGNTYKMAVAYWDADETPAGWTDVGHYSTCKDPDTLDFSWIEILLEAPFDVDGLSDRVDNVDGAADAAQSAADEANATAGDAMSAASDAQQSADDAKSAAEQGTLITYGALLIAIIALVIALLAMRKGGRGAGE